MKRPLFILLALGTLAAPAAAQSRKAVSRVHDFHTLDPLTPMTTFDIGFGYESWDDPKVLGQSTNPVSTILPIDIAGHFVTEAGAGAYVHLPLTVIDTRDTPITQGDGKIAIGNAEVGGMYNARFGNSADMVVHAGLALPTATDDSEVLGGEGLGGLGAFPRIGDLVARVPDTTWLRIGASPMGRVGPAFWQFDVGVDVMVAHDDDYADISPVIHVGAGAGVDLGQADITGELQTAIEHQPNGSNADDVQSTLAIGARFKSQNVQPGLAVVIPVGFDDFDNFNLAVVVSLAARVP